MGASAWNPLKRDCGSDSVVFSYDLWLALVVDTEMTANNVVCTSVLSWARCVMMLSGVVVNIASRYPAKQIRFGLGVLLTLWVTSVFAQCQYFDGFVDAGDGTVIDPRTGIVWQRCASGQVWDGTVCLGTGIEVNWIDAVYVAAEDRTQGQSDWRLPTRSEFEAVVGEYEKCSTNDWLRGKFAASKSIASVVKNPYPGYFWSATKNDADGREIFVTNFIHGQSLPNPPTGFGCCNVKLVRGGRDLSVAETLGFLRETYKKDKLLKSELEEEERKQRLRVHQEEIQRLQAKAAKDLRIQNNARLSEKYFAGLRCEEGKKLSESGEADERPSFGFEQCVQERKFRAIEASRDPMTIYLAAVRYEHESERARAKTLYVSILDRFPSHSIALKAADRLTALADVQAIERSNSALERSNAAREQATREANMNAERRAGEARQSLDRANSDAGKRAYNACRIEVDSCYSRGGKNCYRNCESLR